MSSKWCCVLAVVCLSVILLSLDTDAQPTVDDDSSQCGSASLQQVANMVEALASNQQENAREISDLKNMFASENETRVIASNQQEMKDGIQENGVEIRKMKDGMHKNVVELRKMMDEMKNESDRVRAEMEDVKRLVLSRPTECECATVKPTDCSTCPSVTTTTSPPEHSTLEPAKQQRVSALVCEYAV